MSSQAKKADPFFCLDIASQLVVFNLPLVNTLVPFAQGRADAVLYQLRCIERSQPTPDGGGPKRMFLQVCPMFNPCVLFI